MGRYDETESLWLLPAFMREDDFDAAMSEIVDEFGADLSAATRKYSVWDAIDQMDEASIDALADELNVIWYDKAASLASKREVIKNSKRIQMKLGTKWALEEILRIYFSGDVYVTEWFDYEGEPGKPNHFTVEAEALAGTVEESERFLAIMGRVKRKSAILDDVIGVISADGTPQAAIWPQDRVDLRVEARR